MSIFTFCWQFPSETGTWKCRLWMEARSTFPLFTHLYHNTTPNSCPSGPESAPVSRKSIPGKPAKCPDFLLFKKIILTALINRIRHNIGFELSPQT